MFHLVLPTETLPENGIQIPGSWQPFCRSFCFGATLVGIFCVPIACLIALRITNQTIILFVFFLVNQLPSLRLFANANNAVTYVSWHRERLEKEGVERQGILFCIVSALAALHCNHPLSLTGGGRLSLASSVFFAHGLPGDAISVGDRRGCSGLGGRGATSRRRRAGAREQFRARQARLQSCPVAGE
ncbi:MAG: hypothetical protein ABGX47_05955 [Martelella sp.]|uniref:hypothetical protein n=1 Tax=Martelella sp. TaxID=1969699 RepID=UPI003242DB4D